MGDGEGKWGGGVVWGWEWGVGKVKSGSVQVEKWGVWKWGEKRGNWVNVGGVGGVIWGVGEEVGG